MSKKGDDVKTLFAHLGLDPEDYRELGGDEDTADTGAKPDDDNWPHLDQPAATDEPPEAEQEPPPLPTEGSVPPRMADDGDDAEASDRDHGSLQDDVVDDVLDDAYAARQADAPADSEPDTPTEQPAPKREAPKVAAPPPRAARMPEAGVEPGPERWSLLSNFDDLAGDPPEAHIEGLDETPEPSQPERSWPAVSVPVAEAASEGLVDKAKRLFRSQGEADARPARRSGPANTADEFWDEVAPQVPGDATSSAAQDKAGSDDDEPQAEERYAEPELPRRHAPAPQSDKDSALGSVMARLRAGPGPRAQTKARLNLELDAPTRKSVREDSTQDADLSSVFNRLKTTRRD